MKKIIITLIFTATMAWTIQAQTPRVSYFMDKYANRHQRNPALSPAWGYINFPALGALDIGTESNLRLSRFLYPKDGKLTTFMNEDIDADDFLKKIRKRNSLDVKISEQILGFGFYVNNDQFYSFDLNVRVETGFALPKDLFAFFKNMESGTNYRLTDMNFVGRGYIEAALGHARDINEDLRVGGKLKFLIGVADARVKLDEMNISIGAENEPWKVNTIASGTVLGNFIELETDSTGAVDGFNTPDNMGVSSFLGGYGGAIDLGVSYKLDKILGDLLPMLPLKGFTASFGLTDLGFIKYSKSAKIKAQGEVVYDGFENIQISDSIDVGDEVDHLMDEFEEMVKLRPDGEGNGGARGLRTTANLGLEYSFMEDKMSAGLLWSTHFGYPARYSELTLSYNLRPCNWFSLTLASSFAHGFFKTVGWAINLTPKYGLNFFFGSDYTPIAYSTQWIPVHTANVNFHFGMSIPMGRNRYKKYLKTETAGVEDAINDRSLMTE